MEITGKCKVIRKDKVSSAGNAYIQYSLMISSKDQDGNWHNGFLDAQFSKGTDLTNKTVINVKSGFPMVGEYNGRTYIKWYIKDYTVEGGQSEQGFLNVPDDGDLPFASPTR